MQCCDIYASMEIHSRVAQIYIGCKTKWVDTYNLLPSCWSSTNMSWSCNVWLEIEPLQFMVDLHWVSEWKLMFMWKKVIGNIKVWIDNLPNLIYSCHVTIIMTLTESSYTYNFHIWIALVLILVFPCWKDSTPNCVVHLVLFRYFTHGATY